MVWWATGVIKNSGRTLPASNLDSEGVEMLEEIIAVNKDAVAALKGVGVRFV